MYASNISRYHIFISCFYGQITELNAINGYGNNHNCRREYLISLP